MKKLTLLSVILIALLSFLIFNLIEEKRSMNLVSPLLKAESVLGVNQWLPKASSEQSDVLKISAKSALFLETKSGEVLYSKNIHARLPIASLVKVMTTLIALENRSMDDEFQVSQRASEMEPDKMLLIAGERLALKELLYGVFLVSANDGAEVISENTTGDRMEFNFDEKSNFDRRKEFIKLMNDKAKQLGMADTFYANPTGLDEDTDNSYSTAYDLAILTRYLIHRYPQIVDISSTEHIYLPKTSTHQDYDMYSGINLLTTYPGVLGFKTGYTPEAGLTLITLARKGNYEVIGVLLGSENRRDDARGLLDYSLKKLGSF